MTTIAALLAEKQRRESVARQTDRAAKYTAIADELQGWFHDKQREFYASPAKRKALLKTRRTGATSGGVREFLRRALTIPGWRGRYVNEVREEAKTLAWRADTKQGFVDIINDLAKAGRLKIAAERSDLDGDADVKIDEATLTIDFRNGSQIRIFAADDRKSQERGRGGAPHVLWVDEAQKYPGLQNFVDQVFGASMRDQERISGHKGETWLTGTPSEFLDGYFYDVTRDDDLALRVPGWEVAFWDVRDNPFWGVTAKERWANTGSAEITEKQLDPDNLPAWFKREWLGQWVKEDARFVISIHRWPKPVTFAPLRTTSTLPHWFDLVNADGLGSPLDRWYDHEASIHDLPKMLAGTSTAIDWFYGMGIDFGYNPDPFAIVLWAWSPSMPDLYEMWSWKRTLVLPDYQRDAVMWFYENVRALMNVDGDAGGLQGAHMEGWRELLGLPIEDADKAAKRTWTEMFNNDGERGRIHLREGSPLYSEAIHLTYMQRGEKMIENADRRLADGTVPGNHVLDAARYSYRRYVNRNREEYQPPPREGTPEWYAAEERKMRDTAREQTRAMLEVERGQGDSFDWASEW